MITVEPATAPVLTMPIADFTLNQMGSVAVTATGYPTALITETGALPAGLTFGDNGNGTALISGTPTATGTFDLSDDGGERGEPGRHRDLGGYRRASPGLQQ